jgi:hypothetical protein
MWNFLLLGCEVIHPLICINLAKELSRLFSYQEQTTKPEKMVPNK